MKTIKLSKKTIATIGKVTSLVGKSNVLPILECSKAENGDLTFSDLENTIVFKKIGIEGSTCIPSVSLNNVLKLFPEFHVTVGADNNITFLSPDNSESLKVQGEAADDFPSHPDTDNLISLGTLPDSAFNQLKIAEKFVSKDDLRPAMTCVAFTQGYIMATDAHQIYWELSEFKPAETLLLPLKCRRLIQLFHTTEDPLALSCNARTLVMENEQAKIYCHRVDERFPDVLSVIPQENNSGFIIAKDLLTPVLAKAISQANSITHMIRFDISRSTLSLSSEDIDLKTEYAKSFGSSAEIRLRDNAPTQIGFDGKLLENILGVCGDVITLKMSTPNRAAIINDCFLLIPRMLN